MNIFNKYYETEVYDIKNIRDIPLTTDELKKNGLNEQATKDYFNAVKELYLECLLFNTCPCLNNISNNYINQFTKKYNDYLELCLQVGLIDQNTYLREIKLFNTDSELFNKELQNELRINNYIFPEFKETNISRIENIEEFRVKLESHLAFRSHDWYLNLKYNVWEIRCEKNYIIKFEKENLNAVKLKYLEFSELLNTIKKDLSETIKKIEQLRTELFQKLKSKNYQLYDFNKLLEKRIQLEKEKLLIENCLDIVEESIGSYSDMEKFPMKKENIPCCKDDILYIYRKNVKCHLEKHRIISATAIIYDKKDRELKLNVEYCTECKKYLLEYSRLENYRNMYGVIIANLRMAINGNFDGEYDLALESPLKLSGYNVGQKDSYKTNERHYILAKIIHKGIMSKNEVIRYLTYFIRTNGARKGNESALRKWQEDLEFVENYNINIQPSTIIREIRPY